MCSRIEQYPGRSKILWSTLYRKPGTALHSISRSPVKARTVRSTSQARRLFLAGFWSYTRSSTSCLASMAWGCPGMPASTLLQYQMAVSSQGLVIVKYLASQCPLNYFYCYLVPFVRCLPRSQSHHSLSQMCSLSQRMGLLAADSRSLLSLTISMILANCFTI